MRIRTLFIATMAPLVFANCTSVSEVERIDKKTGTADTKFRVVSLYFLSSKRAIQPAVAEAPPVRWIRTGDRFATRVVRTLLDGPNEAEHGNGYYVNYFPPGPTGIWPTKPAPTKPLKNYFNSVKIVDRVAIVDFDQQALVYLNSPAALQFSVKNPIGKTLIKLPEIDDVKFSIKGKEFTAWNA